MIGEFVDGTNLECKAHRCTISEMRARFGLGCRSNLCSELEHFLECARRCGFLYAIIGGSFATSKPSPGDLDITWFGPPGMSRSNVPSGCVALMEQEKSR